MPTIKTVSERIAERAGRKPQTELQKVCLQYGKDCWTFSNSHTLARFLRENGQPDPANNVEIAMNRAKEIAKRRYFAGRKAIQPDWEDWSERSKRLLAEDTRARNIWLGEQP